MTFPKNSPFTPTDEAKAVGQKAIDGMNAPRQSQPSVAPILDTIIGHIQHALALFEDNPTSAMDYLEEARGLLKGL